MSAPHPQRKEDLLLASQLARAHAQMALDEIEQQADRLVARVTAVRSGIASVFGGTAQGARDLAHPVPVAALGAGLLALLFWRRRRRRVPGTHEAGARPWLHWIGLGWQAWRLWGGRRGSEWRRILREWAGAGDAPSARPRS